MKLVDRKGFTLLELLTTAVIMLLVCAFVLKISSYVLDTWGRVSKKSEGASELKLILDVIEGDLETSLPYYWSDGKQRFSFYSYGESDLPNAIVYEVGDGGLYRVVKEGLKHYDVTEKLSPPVLSSKAIIKETNLLSKKVRALSMKFFSKDRQGKLQWTAVAPFDGTLVCIELMVSGDKGEEMRRWITMVGVESL